MTKKLMMSVSLVAFMALASTTTISFASDKDEFTFKDEVTMQKELEIKQQELQGNFGNEGKTIVANPDVESVQNLRGIADVEAAGFDKNLLEDVKGFENTSAGDPLGRGADQFESAGQRATRTGQDIAANPLSNGLKSPSAPNQGLGLVSGDGTLPGNSVDDTERTSSSTETNPSTGRTVETTVTSTGSHKEVTVRVSSANGTQESHTVTTRNPDGSSSAHYTESSDLADGTHSEVDMHNADGRHWVGTRTDTSPSGETTSVSGSENVVKPGRRQAQSDCAELDCGSGDNYEALVKAFGKKRADAMMAERRKDIRRVSNDQGRPAEQSSGGGDKVTVELSKWDVLGNPALEDYQARGGGKDLNNVSHNQINPGNPNKVEDLF